MRYTFKILIRVVTLLSLQKTQGQIIFAREDFFLIVDLLCSDMYRDTLLLFYSKVLDHLVDIPLRLSIFYRISFVPYVLTLANPNLYLDPILITEIRL